ncbi:MAG: HAD family hydrolase [Bacteroidales bacterium]|nr:HAD family hydrolase [Bacteroidales bacterium]
MQSFLNNIKVIAFDADDTLWDNEPFFRQTEDFMCNILASYGDKEDISSRLFEIEMANMDDYGYGAVAFTMSLIETAVKVSDGKIPANDIGKIIEAGRKLVRLPATPLAGVVETLKLLKESGKYKLVIYTKGELLTQENKLKRSGLLPFFNQIFIVTDKKEEDYRKLCAQLQITPTELLMIGNSLRSDILPALNIGANAIYVPYAVMWQHEVIEDFNHEKMIRINTFEDLAKILL